MRAYIVLIEELYLAVLKKSGGNEQGINKQYKIKFSSKSPQNHLLKLFWKL